MEEGGEEGQCWLLHTLRDGIQSVSMMRSMLPWVGLESSVWSRAMGFFTLLQDYLDFVKKNLPDSSLTDS